MTQFRQSNQRVSTQYNAGQITIQQAAHSLTEVQREQNRLRMLERVQGIWISGVLEPALQGLDPLELEWHDAPDAVVTAFWSVFQESESSRLAVTSAHTSIVQDYDQASGELLILGEPGSGKTILLLELARTLLARAHLDENQPMPVVFQLSSWASTRRPLTEWLASELHSRYQIPLPLATFWIANDQVLPLLDGLDEVTVPQRLACVEAINSYRQTHGLLPTVVCSRQSDYLILAVRLLLRAAVVVQPLTSDKIGSYLEHGGEWLEALRLALDEDVNLRSLVRTPLLLNVLALSYNDGFYREGTEASELVTKREYVFDVYVRRMLARRMDSNPYRSAQTLHWLSCLAQYMKRQNQAVFYIEQLQPDDSLASTRIYRWGAIILPAMLLGICACLIINILSGGGLSLVALLENILLGTFLGGMLSTKAFFVRGIRSECRAWKRYGLWLASGISLGVGFGLIEGLHSEQRFSPLHGLFFGLSGLLLSIFILRSQPALSVASEQHAALEKSWQSFIHSSWLHNGLLIGAVIGLSFGVCDGVLYDLRIDSVGLSSRLGDALVSGPTNGWIIALNAVLKGSGEGRFVVGLLYGLCSYGMNFGFVGGLLSLLLGARGVAMHLSDRLVWSWSSIGRCLCSRTHLRTTVQLMLCVGVVDGLSDGLVVAASMACMVALIYWLLLGFFQGVPDVLVEDHQRLLPNQGVHRSGLNGLLLGLITAGVVVLIFVGSGLVFVLLDRDIPSGGILSATLRNGLLTGLCAGLLAGSLKGGWACLQHYILRFLLWRRGTIPWNYARFLDSANERLLLRKVGGGYIFLHRLFLDYFVELGTNSSVSFHDRNKDNV